MNAFAPGWFVPLSGEDADKSIWERSLKPPFDPWCERIIRSETSYFGIRSSAFNHMTDAQEVRDKAISLVMQMNGAFRLCDDALPLMVDSVIQIDASGKFHHAMFAEAGHIKLRGFAITATAEVRNADGSIPPPPPPQRSEVQRWAQLAESNEDVADMLIFASRGDSWFDIYKALELARSIAGSQRKLETLLGQSSKKYENLRRTANFYRHAREKQPPVMVTLTDAQPLLAFIVRAVLDPLAV